MREEQSRCFVPFFVEKYMPRVIRADKNGVHRGQFEKNKKRIFATQECCGICGKPVDFSLRYPHPLCVQKVKDQKQKIGIKPQKADFPLERIESVMNKISSIYTDGNVDG